MTNIKVIFVNTNELSLEEILSSPFLNESNLKDLQRFKVDETKKEKAYSLILKNKYVGKHHLNEFGKPISDSCFFNVSHSKGAVVFVKDSLPIGIDIEKIRPVKDKMKDYISSIEEKEYIKDDISFFEIWTSKESLSKTIGTGIREKVKDIPALPIDGVKEYKGKEYRSLAVKYKDYIICITRESDEPFSIEIDK